MGVVPRDPIRESVSLILDAINLCELRAVWCWRPWTDKVAILFLVVVRIVQVMLLQQRKK